MSALGGPAPLAYRRRASPLHAARASVTAAYAAALACAALITQHPLLLGGLLLAVLGAGAASGVGRDLARAAARAALPLLLLSVLVNMLVSRGGLTVFARLGDWGVLGQMNLTVEAVVYGLVFGLRLLVVTLACMLAVCTADPDELLFAARRFSPRSALTATLATRLLPVLGADARRLADAQRCRAGGAPRGALARLAILRASVSGALERSLDVAAVLEMRGYGAPGRTRRAHRPPSRHDLAFATAALAVLTLALVADSGALAPFAAYPLSSIPITPGWVLCAALAPLLALAPFAERRGIDP